MLRWLFGVICRLPWVMVRSLSILAVLSIIPVANALEGLSLNIAVMEAKHWQLKGIQIALTDLAKSPQQLGLTINTLTLPKPFNDLSLVNIRCSAFTWQNKALLCKQGKAQLQSKQWQSPSANFSFHIQENHSQFHLNQVQLAGAHFNIDAEETGLQWTLRINAKAVEGKLVQKWLPPKLLELKNGKLSFQLNASGSGDEVKEFILATELYDLSGQTEDGRFAVENLLLETQLDAHIQQGTWQWQNHAEFKAGALYAEPLYLSAGAQTIVLDAEGAWNPANGQVEIRSAKYQHPRVVTVIGRAFIQTGKALKVEQAQLSLNSDNLQEVSALYLKPFFEATALEGVSLDGHLKADISVQQQAVTDIKLVFNELDIKDESARFGLKGGAGRINWASDEAFNQSSELGWHELRVRALPVGPSNLVFLTKVKSIRLLDKTKLPFLGGEIAIHAFKWQRQKQEEPEVYFAGNVDNVSLEQLSKALNWTPLSGNISGQIPSVNYSNKTLSLGGELMIKVFDGEVKISNLASSGLFTDFPKLHAELEIDHLDLDQLTRKFEFGGIKGKLSGFVRDLYLENWQPVTFYAWLGTPDDDDSSHRISQKAVKNIASIGGGGAADVLSRSFMGLFETFMYDKIGMGCYLHNGVCQLMGVEPAKQGYYIIKGGGLPRIDVIGYNPRLDWNVLMQRLKRISTSDEVIIE